MGRGLREHEEHVVPGAQTERRGDAWLVSGLPGGKDLTSRVR
jgi:hypothetical protein